VRACQVPRALAYIPGQHAPGIAIDTEEFRIAQLRQRRDLLLRAARRHGEACGSLTSFPGATVAQRMHLALARNRLFLARRLNRQIVAALRRRAQRGGAH
jgi:hypothetical protein